MEKIMVNLDSISVAEIDDLMKRLKQIRKDKVVAEANAERIKIGEMVLKKLPDGMTAEEFLNKAFSSINRSEVRPDFSNQSRTEHE